MAKLVDDVLHEMLCTVMYDILLAELFARLTISSKEGVSDDDTVLHSLICVTLTLAYINQPINQSINQSININAYVFD